jgi:hypothetical protein
MGANVKKVYLLQKHPSFFNSFWIFYIYFSENTLRFEGYF